jgi:hypothetical protein
MNHSHRKNPLGAIVDVETTGSVRSDEIVELCIILFCVNHTEWRRLWTHTLACGSRFNGINAAAARVKRDWLGGCQRARPGPSRSMS